MSVWLDYLLKNVLMIEPIYTWLTENWVELLASVFGLIYLYFSVKQNILLWVFGLLTSALYIYVYFESRFYADMSLQVYYVVISIYGWLHWTRGGTDNSTLKVTKTSLKVLSVCVLASLSLWYAIYCILQFTNTDVPIGDAFTTAAAIVATWMLARKLLENWLFWIVIDFVSLILYIQKGLWATSVLFLIYTVVAVVGYFSWKRDMEKALEP
jgi:nicotinamide mononucleotide transporter